MRRALATFLFVLTTLGAWPAAAPAQPVDELRDRRDAINAPFRALIDDDGTLRFEDAPTVRPRLPESWTDFPEIAMPPSGYDPSDPFARDIATGPVFLPVRYTVDLFDILNPSPNAYRKIEIEKRTRALRDRLADEARNAWRVPAYIDRGEP